MEYGIYLLAVFLFIDKGSAFRSIGLYIPPLALICRIYLTRKQPFALRDPLFLSLTVLCASAVISSLVSDETISFLVWVRKRYLKAFLIFIVVTAAFKERNVLKKLLVFLSILSLPFIALTFYDYITKALAENGVILFGHVRKYNYVLPYLLPFIPFALLAARSKLQKIFWILTLCIGGCALLLTGFRGGLISFFVSIVIWAVWLSAGRFHKHIIPIIAGFVLIAYIILSLLPSSHIAVKIKQGFWTHNRYEWIWKPYIHMYSEFPLENKVFGTGMTDETMYNYHSLYRQTLDRYPDINHIPLSPHSQYINILFRQGILGLILYISLVILYVVLLITTIRKRNFFEDKAMGIAILCPFVGEYIVHGIVESMRFMPMGLLLGMASAYLRNKERSKKEIT
jgi:O-antigen ligase